MNRLNAFFIPIRHNLVALGIFLTGWYVTALFFDSCTVPSPVDIIGEFGGYCDRKFLNNLGITFLRITSGFLVAIVLGTLIGLSAHILKISRHVETLMLIIQVLPGTILGIIFLLIFGVGNMAPFMLIITLTTPLLAIHTSSSLMKQHGRLEKLIRSFSGGWKEIVRDLYLPSLVPTIRSNLTTGMVFSVKIALIGEFIASDNGIGYLLNVSKIYFDMTAVFFYLFVVVFVVVAYQICVHTVFGLLFKKYLYPD